MFSVPGAFSLSDLEETLYFVTDMLHTHICSKLEYVSTAYFYTFRKIALETVQDLLKYTNV